MVLVFRELSAHGTLLALGQTRSVTRAGVGARLYLIPGGQRRR